MQVYKVSGAVTTRRVERLYLLGGLVDWDITWAVITQAARSLRTRFHSAVVSSPSARALTAASSSRVLGTRP